MKNLTAFILGLFTGKNASSSPNKTELKKRVRNIRLQDIAFCQCLRNQIDELEDYVKLHHPTPENFIRHILQLETFVEPYTKEEIEIMERNRQNIQKYVDWINSKTNNKNLKGGKDGENICALRRIWQDEVHTPDINNLDLLFGDCLLSEPIKANGRLYEYRKTIALQGLAEGFFDSIPAQIIFAKCVTCTKEILKKYGFDYDYKRFEYYHEYDKTKSTINKKEIQMQERIKWYKRLLIEMPSFCRNTWSNYTASTKNVEMCKKTSLHKVEKKERLRRKIEVVNIYNTLTAEEKNNFSIDSNKSERKSKYTISIICICIFLLIVLLIASPMLDESLEKRLIAGYIFTVIYLASFAVNGKWKDVFSDEVGNVCNYITTLQRHYYENLSEEGAKKYSELLKRINKETCNSTVEKKFPFSYSTYSRIGTIILILVLYAILLAIIEFIIE